MGPSIIKGKDGTIGQMGKWGMINLNTNNNLIIKLIKMNYLFKNIASDIFYEGTIVIA